jgi:hypothetical protein
MCNTRVTIAVRRDNVKEKTNLGDLVVDGRILKLALMEKYVTMWTGISCGFFELRELTFFFRKKREICLLGERHFGSHEVH